MKLLLAVLAVSPLSFAALGTSVHEPLSTAAEASTAPAAPHAPFEFQPEVVPAGATSLFHVDFAQFRASALGRWFFEHRDDFELDEIDEMRDELGVDPLLEIDAISGWGLGEDEEADLGGLVLFTTSALDRVLEHWSKMDGFRSMRQDGVDLFFFEETYGYVQQLADGRRAMVAASTADMALLGARVLRGESPSLASVPDPVVKARPMAGSYAFFAAVDLAAARDFEPASQVFGLAQGVQLDLGEAGSSFFARLSVPTGSLDDARDVSDVLQGIIALGSLLAGEDVPAELRDMLRALRVNSRGNLVTVDFEVPVETVGAFMRSLEDGEDF